jgi:hypothetical protein
MLAFSLLFASCSNGGGGGKPAPQTVTYSGTVGGETYTLKITENTARYSAQASDTYELTTGSNKLSKGTVVSFIDGVIKLKPKGEETTFDMTVDAGVITEAGTIIWCECMSGGSNCQCERGSCNCS